MTCWIEHNQNTWIVEDKARRVVALVRYHKRTNLYAAKKSDKKLGYYSTLQSAMEAATPANHKLLKHTHIKPQHQQFNTKTTEAMPWDS